MPGRTTEEKGRFNKQVGAVRQVAGMLKDDKALEVKGRVQRAKGSVQEAAGKAARKVTE